MVLTSGKPVGARQVGGVEDGGVARAVGVEHRLVGVPHDMAWGVSGEDRVGELRLVAGAGSRVQHLEALAHGDHHVPSVTGRVEARERLGVEFGERVERLAVEDQDPALVGDGDAGGSAVSDALLPGVEAGAAASPPVEHDVRVMTAPMAAALISARRRGEGARICMPLSLW